MVIDSLVGGRGGGEEKGGQVRSFPFQYVC